MTDIARYIKLDGQPPLVRLVFSFCTVVVAGTLLFWVFLYAGSLIIGVPAARMIQLPSGDPGQADVAILRYVQFSQHLGVFLLPALLTGWMISSRGSNLLGLGKPPLPVSILIVVAAGLLIIPLVDFTSALNARMDLSASFSGVQHWMRTKEDTATRLTGMLLSSGGFPSLLLNYFLLAIMPALSEEMLFRGVFQKLFSEVFRSGHAAVWVTAVIFSSVHLQFFGFFPRLILGLLFGYLYCWSGNLWYPVIAHFINNAIPVTIAWFTGINKIGGEPVKENFSIPVLVITSLLTVLLLFSFYRESSKTCSTSPDSGIIDESSDKS